VTAHSERLARLEQARTAQGQTWWLQPVVDALPALRGVQCTVAVIPGATLGDLPCFEHPRPLMRSLGVTPSEYATGERRRQGGLTQAGNTPARRALSEGAGASRYPAQVSRPLPRRLENVPQPLQAMSGQAQGRLGKRYRQLSAHGQHAHQGGVAIARALSALRWAIVQEVPLTP
jgi:hypothetical protein